jgi:hypothetical protein
MKSRNASDLMRKQSPPIALKGAKRTSTLENNNAAALFLNNANSVVHSSVLRTVPVGGINGRDIRRRDPKVGI